MENSNDYLSKLKESLDNGTFNSQIVNRFNEINEKAENIDIKSIEISDNALDRVFVDEKIYKEVVSIKSKYENILNNIEKIVSEIETLKEQNSYNELLLHNYHKEYGDNFNIKNQFIVNELILIDNLKQEINEKLF